MTQPAAADLSHFPSTSISIRFLFFCEVPVCSSLGDGRMDPPGQGELEPEAPHGVRIEGLLPDTFGAMLMVLDGAEPSLDPAIEAGAPMLVEPALGHRWDARLGEDPAADPADLDQQRGAELDRLLCGLEGLKGVATNEGAGNSLGRTPRVDLSSKASSERTVGTVQDPSTDGARQERASAILGPSRPRARPPARRWSRSRASM